MTLPVVEVFGPTLQGEGAHIGEAAVFIRLAGCDFDCYWCDTRYALVPGAGTEMDELDVLDAVRALGAPKGAWAVLTGGNPAIHDCGELVRSLRRSGFPVSCETQGSRAPAWLRSVDHLTLSPKPPSSGMTCDEEVLAECLHGVAYGSVRQTELKVTVFGREDVEWAVKLAARLLPPLFTLMAGNRRLGELVDVPDLLVRTSDVSRWAVELGSDARVLPQLHVLLWGNARGR